MTQSDSDSNFSIDIKNRRKTILRKAKKEQKLRKNQFKISAGKWCLNQIKLYIEFLKLYKSEINSYANRREIKIFKLMSNFVKTRTSDQCRSHHQKVQKIHPQIDQIITYYGKKVQSILKKIQLHNESEKQKQIQKDTKLSCQKCEDGFLFRLTQNMYGLVISFPLQIIQEF